MKSIRPNLVSISEVNEPQEKVFEYLGTKINPESDFVYQFTHFPLAIHTLLSQDTSDYAKWFKTTKKFDGKQFVTILGSHDGLGLKPLRNILPESKIDDLATHLVNKHGALPNYAILPGGKKIIYELCSTPWNLIVSPDDHNEIGTQKVMVVVAMGLLTKGIPAFYVNGLIAADNYKPEEGLDENRTVNREVFDLDTVSRILKKTYTKNSKTLKGILRLAKVRNNNSEFDANSPFPTILDIDNKAILAMVLYNKKGGKLISLINVSGSEQEIAVPKNLTGKYTNLIEESRFELKTKTKLLPFQVLWIK